MEIIASLRDRILFVAQSFFVRLQVVRTERGLAALEYLALAVLLVVVVAGAFQVFGNQVEDKIQGLFDDIF